MNNIRNLKLCAQLYSSAILVDKHKKLEVWTSLGELKLNSVENSKSIT